MKLVLPEKKEESFWFHKNNTGSFDYAFKFGFKSLDSVILSDNAPELNALILPKIDFQDYDFDGIGSYKKAVEILKHASTSTEPQVNNALNALINGKYSIQPKAIQFPYVYKSIPEYPSNIIITGNASIKFNLDSFGKYSNINLILPKGMKLFKIKEVINTYFSQIIKENYLIGHSVLAKVKNFKDGESIISVEEVDQIYAESSKISLDKSHYFDRTSNEISHYEKDLSV